MKKLLGSLLSVLMIVTCVCLNTNVTVYADDATSGYCGDTSVNDGKDVTWSYVQTNHSCVLTISGSGKMQDYEATIAEGSVTSTTAPWWGKKINTIYVEENVTYIGNYAFSGLMTTASNPNVYIFGKNCQVSDNAFTGAGSASFHPYLHLPFNWTGIRTTGSNFQWCGTTFQKIIMHRPTFYLRDNTNEGIDPINDDLSYNTNLNYNPTSSKGYTFVGWSTYRDDYNKDNPSQSYIVSKGDNNVYDPSDFSSFVYSSDYEQYIAPTYYAIWENNNKIVITGTYPILQDIDDDYWSYLNDNDENVFEKYGIKYDKSNKKLYLNDATIDPCDIEDYGIKLTKDTTIVLSGNNTIGKAISRNEISNGEYDDYNIKYGIYSEGKSLTFKGSGNLTINDMVSGIWTSDSLLFDEFNGTLTINDYGAEIGDGHQYDPCCCLHANNITINGGTFDLYSYCAEAIDADNDLTITSGTITATSVLDNAICADNVTVTGGITKAKGSDKAVYQANGTTPLAIASYMKVDGASETDISSATFLTNKTGTEYVVISPKTYTISFNSNGGSSVKSVSPAYNSTITRPTDPTKTGYAFGGWYKDVALTNAWNFDTDKVTADTTLYAKWFKVITTDSSDLPLVDGSAYKEFTKANTSLSTLHVEGLTLSDIKTVGNLHPGLIVMNGSTTLVEGTDYSVTSGSLKVNLNKSYLDTLPVGLNAITVYVDKDQDATTTNYDYKFNIKIKINETAVSGNSNNNYYYKVPNTSVK